MIRSASIRSQRIQRRVSRGRKASGLNLVSLMDIFTILVFFLLVNSAQVEVLPNAKDLELPESLSTDKPAEQVLLMVTRDAVLVNGRRVSGLDAVRNASSPVIPTLKSELLQMPLVPVVGGTPGQTSRGDVNIMADKDTPFELIKKVMATCTDAKFSRISLAVVSKPGGNGS
jgi:biopolymer transport protein TolR